MLINNKYIFQILVKINKYLLIRIVDLGIIKNFISLILANRKRFSI